MGHVLALTSVIETGAWRDVTLSSVLVFKVFESYSISDGVSERAVLQERDASATITVSAIVLCVAGLALTGVERDQAVTPSVA